MDGNTAKDEEKVKMSITVWVRDLSKASVLSILYNASAPMGEGFRHAINGPVVMTLDGAEECIRLGGGGLVFDDVYGRPLKVDLTKDSFDPGLYDHHNGGAGTAGNLVAKLRKTRKIYSSYVHFIHMMNMTKRIEEVIDKGNVGGGYRGVVNLCVLREMRTTRVEPDLNLEELPRSPGFKYGRDHQEWSAHEAIRYYDLDPDLVTVAFIELVKQDPRTRWIATSYCTASRLAENSFSRKDMFKAMLTF